MSNSFSKGGGGYGTSLFTPQISKIAITTQPPYTEIIELCTPISNSSFDLSSPPPRTGCGNYSWDLANFPLNQCTTVSGTTETFGASEIALLFLQLRNYPREGGTVGFRLYAPGGRLYYSPNISLPIPDPSWTWWYAWFWAVSGKFDGRACNVISGGEIITPGNYWIDILTPWGNGRVDYTITDSSCPSMSTTLTIPL